jgi:hypothetical protein
MARFHVLRHLLVLQTAAPPPAFRFRHSYRCSLHVVFCLTKSTFPLLIGSARDAGMEEG